MAEEAIGRLEGMQDQTGIGLFNISAERAADASFHEQEAIDKADLFGTHLLESTEYWGVDPFDPSETNPFTGYLRKLTDDLGKPGIVDVERKGLSYGLAQRFPDYDICGVELDRIANGSADGRRALETGDARLSEIPQELMSDDAGEQRAAWLADRLPDVWKGLKDDSPQAKFYRTLSTATHEDMEVVLRELESELDNRKAEEKGGDG